MSLGESIRSLRTGKNLSQNDLAELLKVSRQSISKWETDGATPDLNKLVSMSEIFGVTLDSLVKGSAPTPDPAAMNGELTNPISEAKKVPCQAPRYILGIILLGFGALIAILLFFLGAGLLSLLYASPLLLCGVVCMYAKRRTGLWCGWSVYICLDLYLRYATGVAWSIIFLTPHFKPEMNYMRLAFGWGEFLIGVLLICLTLRSYRKVRFAWNKKHFLFALADLSLLVALPIAQNGIIRHMLSLSQPWDPLYQGLCFWIGFCTDYIRLGLFVVLVIMCMALIRQRRASI